MPKKVVYIIVCAAPPASQIQEFARLAVSQWDVCVIATPESTKFIEVSALEHLTGHAIRSQYKLPGEADALPKADAIVVVPATFNTINKWAAGIADTLAVSILCECMAYHMPIIAVPCLKDTLAQHPIFSKNIAFLQQCGVHMLYEPARYRSPEIVPWQEILNTLNALTQHSPSTHETKSE